MSVALQKILGKSNGSLHKDMKFHLFTWLYLNDTLLWTNTLPLDDYPQDDYPNWLTRWLPQGWLRPDDYPRWLPQMTTPRMTTPDDWPRWQPPGWVPQMTTQDDYPRISTPGWLPPVTSRSCYYRCIKTTPKVTTNIAILSQSRKEGSSCPMDRG